MIKRFFSKNSQKADDEGELKLDYALMDRAQAVSQKLMELQTNSDWFTMQAGLIFLLHQDIFKSFGIDLSRPMGIRSLKNVENNLPKAVEQLTKLRNAHYKNWVEEKDRNDRAGTLMGGMCFNACEFWLTALSSMPSDFVPLKLCVEKNFLAIYSTDKEEVISEAGDLRGMFLDLGDYEFIESHWPFGDYEAILSE